MWVTRLSIVDWVYSRLELNFMEGVLCIFGSRTFVTISWICKKQTSVSHSSTESETISQDAGLRMDGLLALDLWDMVIRVRSTNNNVQPKHYGIVIEVSRSTDNTVKPNHDSIRETCARQNTKTKTPTDKRKQKVDQLSDVDYVPTDTHSSQGESQLYTFEDKEAAIEMTIKG